MCTLLQHARDLQALLQLPYRMWQTPVLEFTSDSLERHIGCNDKQENVHSFDYVMSCMNCKKDSFVAMTSTKDHQCHWVYKTQERHIGCNDKYERSPMSLGLQDPRKTHLLQWQVRKITKVIGSTRLKKDTFVAMTSTKDRLCHWVLQDSQERHICYNDKYERSPMSLGLTRLARKTHLLQWQVRKIAYVIGSYKTRKKGQFVAMSNNIRPCPLVCVINNNSSSIVTRNKRGKFVAMLNRRRE